MTSHLLAATLAAFLLLQGCVHTASHPDVTKLPAQQDLPDPLVFSNGSPVRTPNDWQRRRLELLDLLEHYEYGPLPSDDREHTRGTELISHNVNALRSRHRQFKITCGPQGKVSFVLDLLTPFDAKGKLPVILRGDACWGRVAEPIEIEVLKRGYALAEFNRCEVAPDNANRNTGVYTAFPNRHDTGAIAAWAWGYHRCVDFLLTLEDIDPQKIAIAGHSRGGKTTLLAGATDERIALVVANGSGTAGAAPFRFATEKSESLDAITSHFPYWFTPRLAQFVGNENRLPFDQHELKALIAPRALLCTEALGDLWANPRGSLTTNRAAEAVFKLLSVPDRIAIHFRPGKHEHDVEDWLALLTFADHVFRGAPLPGDFQDNSFEAKVQP